MEAGFTSSWARGVKKHKAQQFFKEDQMNTLLEEKWKQFFTSGFYLRAWDFAREWRSEEEVEGVISILEPEPGDHFLDWCGGTGRHSLLLAQKGFRVTLLDWAPNHLDIAREQARRLGVDDRMEFVCCDFRRTPSNIEADYSLNLFTSGIGYLGKEEDVKALKALRGALKEGALFLLDTMNLFWLVRNYRPMDGRVSPDGSKRRIDQREFDFWTNRNRSRTLYWEEGKEEEDTLEHRIYSAAELAGVLEQAGFKPLSLYGGFDGREFGFDSRRLIMVSRS